MKKGLKTMTEPRPEDVIELTRRRVPDRFIVRQIEDVGVDYVLSPEDYQRLRKAGVTAAGQVG